jgi:hypothetical protein
MKLVWMMIVMATGAMLVIAATLLVKPFDSNGQSSYEAATAAIA